MSNTAAVL